MIRKLKIKFITIATLAISLVLIVLVGGINVYNYVSVVGGADRTLALIENGGGEFPQFRPNGEVGGNNGEMPLPEQKPDEKPSLKPDGISPEAPFETRYFSVRIDDNGEVESVNVDKIAAIDENTAEEYAVDLYAKAAKKGFKDGYRFSRYKDGETTVYLFLDCSREMNTFKDFLTASCILSGCGLVVVIILVTLFSQIAVKPVAEAYAKQKRFITDANHELKTPLTVISASCEVIEIENGESEWTNTIKDEVAKLTDLTNDLVTLCRADEGSAKPITLDFSLSEAAAETAKPFEAVARTENKSYKTIIGSNITVKGDINGIKRLINILLDNAFKYSDEKGNIELEVYEKGRQRVIKVSNDTNGVPTGNLNMLFERFYRLDASRNSSTGGHGIGLSVAKAITERDGGKISAYSPDGKRITFTAIFTA